jgi:hypothetical protein
VTLRLLLIKCYLKKHPFVQCWKANVSFKNDDNWEQKYVYSKTHHHQVRVDIITLKNPNSNAYGRLVH